MMCSVNKTLWIVIHVHVECHSTRRNIFCSVEMFSLQTPCAFANQIPGICLYVVYVLAFDTNVDSEPSSSRFRRISRTGRSDFSISWVN